MLPVLACAPLPGPAAKSGSSAQLALAASDYVLVARNGIDAQVFDGFNEAHGTNDLSLYDEGWGAALSVNQYNIAVTVDDDTVQAVRPYGVTGALSIPADGFAVAVNGTDLPYLAGLAVKDPLRIRPTEVCEPRQAGVPVLMFHDLGATSTAFEAVLEAIDAEGYTTLTQADLVEFLADDGCGELPDNPVLLTFDDAYISHFDYAPELLDAYGMSGIFFVITSYPGSASWVASWASIEDAVASYPDTVELGCHSHAAHVQVAGVPKYKTMTEAQRVTDLEACRDTLELHTGVAPTAIAWPFGAYDEELVTLAQDAGFTLAMNTWPGLNHPENSDAEGHVRRFGANVANAWATTETAIDRWHVCEAL